MVFCVEFMLQARKYITLTEGKAGWHMASLASRAKPGFLLGLIWVWKNAHLHVIPCRPYSAFVAPHLLLLSACVCQTEVLAVRAWHPCSGVMFPGGVNSPPL